MKDKGKRSTDAVVISKYRQLPLSDLFLFAIWKMYIDYCHHDVA